MLRSSSLFSGAVLLLCGCATTPRELTGDAVAITGVTVIDPSSSQPAAAGQTILISNGLIRAVGPAPTAP